MKRGEVWRVRLHSVPGHTQAGIRPAVILQEERFTVSLPTVLIVPFTGTQATTRFPGTVAVQPDARNGLTTPSVALVFQLTAIDRRDCMHFLGVLDSATLDQIFAELDSLTGRRGLQADPSFHVGRRVQPLERRLRLVRQAVGRLASGQCLQ